MSCQKNSISMWTVRFRLVMLAVLAFLICGEYADLCAAEDVSFPSLDQALGKSEATVLRGLLFKPEGPGPFPAIIGLHGCGGMFGSGGKIMSRDAQWADFLSAHGFIVLLVDSFGSRGVGNVCAQRSPAVDPSRERPYDAYAALQYLRTLPLVHADRIGLLGWSQGGATVLFTIDSSAPARPTVLPEGDFRAAVAFYPGWCDGKYHRSGWSSKIPLLVLIGEKDNWTQAAPCRYFLEHSRRDDTALTVVIYPDAFHDFDWPDLPLHAVTSVSTRSGNPTTGTNPAASEDAHKRVLSYFERYLKPGSE